MQSSPEDQIVRSESLFPTCHADNISVKRQVIDVGTYLGGNIPGTVLGTADTKLY